MKVQFLILVCCGMAAWSFGMCCIMPVMSAKRETEVQD